MNVYFIKGDKIDTFKLPKNILGNHILFDYDSNGYKRSLISVEARDGKWVINDNSEVKIKYNANFVSSVNLEIYQFYQLIVYGNENIIMYVCPAYENNFIRKSILDNSKILCGNSNDCDILYNYAGIANHQVEISYVNGLFSFKNLNTVIPIYVNKIRTDSGVLKNFDVLFCMGLKIMFFGSYIYINNSSTLIYIMSNKFISNISDTLIVPNYKATSEVYRDFYEEKEYFFKTPVFQNSIHKLNLVIAPPPAKEHADHSSILITIIPSFLMSASSLLMGYFALLEFRKNPSDIQNSLMTIIMCVGMLLAGIVWPFVERAYSNFIILRKERKRKKMYSKYLAEKEAILTSTLQEQKMILQSRYVSLKDCQDIIYNRSSNLYSRNIDSQDFLTVRLGVGTVPLACNIEFDRIEYTEDKDNLIDHAMDLIKKYEYINEVPFTLSLFDKNAVAFIGPEKLKKHYLDAIILQLLTFHSYKDFKIVVLSNNNSSILNFVKDCNHCWNDDRSFRFFSTSYDDGQVISSYLEKELLLRQATLKSGNGENVQNSSINVPYYLVVSDNISMYKNLKIVKDILCNNHLGFGLIMFDSKVTNIPSGCSDFVNYDLKEASYFKNEMNSDSINKFVPEFIDGINVDSIVSLLSNIPVKIDTNDSGFLPDNLGFLEMNEVGRVEQFNSISKWENSNITNSLAAPVGVDINGNLLNLDLHEKKHGPHGLIAGMTGSGKSEFIITFILSLAVNYSPNEVQFVLIDYKGGGLAGAFENRKTGLKLPHLVGTITNLDKSEMKRTLVSINSELQRRQRVFNEAKEKLNTGTIDIYKYQKLVREGKLTDNLSHLFIICDEFAELKAQQPDFMDELVSAARIGRSLGVHLILATQKPSGVVDEQIWSNSKFKVCCKVQTAEDSNEMIRRPDAAFIKEAGRFYLQVGYDEYFVKGQSAYTGSPYIPSDKIKTKLDNEIDFVNNVGEVVKSVVDNVDSNKDQKNLGEELTNVLQYLIELAKEIGYTNHQLWLDNIPSVIYLEDIRKKYNIVSVPYNINPLIGEYDDPKNQLQGPVCIPITNEGNVYIGGVSGSGKSTLLTTLIFSTIITHNSEEVNFYIIDLLAESLKKFSSAPQVGEFLTIGDKDKIEKLLYFLQKEFEKRKKYYSIHGGSFENDVSNGKMVFPNIIIVINGIDIFKEEFEEIYEELFAPFTRDCSRNGIYFVATGTSASSLGYLVENNFPYKIATKFLDYTDYSLWFSRNDIIPNDNPGRGLIKLEDVYEFQTCLIFEMSVLEKSLKSVIYQLNNFLERKAPKLPTIPNSVSVSLFDNEKFDLESVPIGIEKKSACIYTYNFDRLITMITYSKETSVKDFTPALIYMLSRLNNIKNIVLCAYDFIDVNNENVKFYNANFKKVLITLQKNISKVLSSENTDTKYIITIIGYTKLNAHLQNMKEADDTVILLDDIIMMCEKTDLFRFIIVDNTSLLTNIDNVSWYNLVSTNNGILLSTEFDSQSLFTASDDYNNSSIGRDEAIVIEKGIQKYIKFMK